jgi:hypothetical protein
MSPAARRAFAVFAATLLVVAITGCSKKSKSNATGPGPNPTACTITAADNLLGTLLAQQANSEPQRPSDIDYRPAFDAYGCVFSANPTGPDALHARLGLAVLGLTTITTDTEVNAAFDEWAAYLSSHTPFEVPTGPAPLGVRMGLSSGRLALGLPFRLVPISLIADSRAALVTADPQLARVQAILRDRVIPKLDAAIVHLDAIAATPSFTFIVSPAMQGDPNADPVEVDVTDILAMRAGCNLLASLCHLAVAYQVSFATYDSAGLYAAVQPGSSWLKLYPGGGGDGASHMQAAQTRLVDAVDDVENTLNSLIGETDPQDDDVIRIGPTQLSQAAVDSALAEIGNVRTALLSGWTLTNDWDGNGGTPDVALQIRVDRFFTSPVPDWKALLPAYTGSVTRLPFNVYYVYDYSPANASFTVPSNNYYTGDYSYSVYGGLPYEYSYGDPQIIAGLQPLVQARYTAAQGAPGFNGEFSGSASFSGALTAGPHVVSINVYSSYTRAATSVAVPVITWVAADFGSWTFPDPTMNGLFPGLTSHALFINTFGITAGSWQRVNVLDWTGSGY